LKLPILTTQSFDNSAPLTKLNITWFEKLSKYQTLTKYKTESINKILIDLIRKIISDQKSSGKTNNKNQNYFSIKNFHVLQLLIICKIKLISLKLVNYQYRNLKIYLY